MKKIIEGKMYNTETATYIGRYRTDTMSRRDFRYLEEELYQKRTKEFFLCGEGGAMTKYAKYVEGCGYTDGEKSFRCLRMRQGAGWKNIWMWMTTLNCSESAKSKTDCGYLR